MPSRAPLTFSDVLSLCEDLPGAVESTSYGTPSVAVKGKSFTRLKEDGETLVLKVPTIVRDHLMQADPKVFFITDHYRGYPAVLVRLKLVKKKQLKELLETAWFEVAPKRLAEEYRVRTP